MSAPGATTGGWRRSLGRRSLHQAGPHQRDTLVEIVSGWCAQDDVRPAEDLQDVMLGGWRNDEHGWYMDDPCVDLRQKLTHWEYLVLFSNIHCHVATQLNSASLASSLTAK